MGHTFNPGASKSLKFNHTVRTEVYSTNYMDSFLSIFSIGPCRGQHLWFCWSFHFIYHYYSRRCTSKPQDAHQTLALNLGPSLNCQSLLSHLKGMDATIRISILVTVSIQISVVVPSGIAKIFRFPNGLV